MDLINGTRMAAGYAMGLEPSGRELLVIVVKGTFRIPDESGARLGLHEEQAPLAMADSFFGEPGLSAPKYEADFAPLKPRCDVLLNGSAYAPGGRPADRVTVGIGIGRWSKSFAVVGDRVWLDSGGVMSTAPEPFVAMPVNYDYAFGGADLKHVDPGQHAAFTANPTGRGFHKHLTREWLEGSPLPNTEEHGVTVARPDVAYRPMAFGIIGRHWDPRSRYAGTYDKRWLDQEFPFLPSDFDVQYYQSALADQQLPLPVGEETVVLNNLTPDGHRQFRLPHFEAPIQIFPKRGGREDLIAHADTIFIEPDLARLTMTWRVARPLKRNMFEIAQVLVGRKGSEWWQQRSRPSFPLPIVVEFVPDPSGAVISGEAEETEESNEADLDTSAENAPADADELTEAGED